MRKVRSARLSVMVLTVLAVVSSISTPARADFAAGMEAYAAGDPQTALQEWIREGRGGNTRALWLVGNLYLNGEGVDQPSPRIAADYYLEAAELGFAEAQLSLATLYRQGRGVERDLEQALAWLYQAAAQRHPEAQVDLADLFLEGGDGALEPDPVHASQWYGQAADQGVVFAQFKLAQMHLEGVGLTKDEVTGFAWLTIAHDAATDGRENARSKRVMLLSALVPGLRPERTLAQLIVETYERTGRGLRAGVLAEARKKAADLSETLP